MAELDELKRKLAARQGRIGYEANCRAIEQRIAELEAGQTEETNDGGQEGE
jgi:hypothetical protein